MPKKTLTEEAVDGIGWQSLAIGANIFLRAVILILLARAISPAEFGIIAAATVVISITGKLAQLGVSRVLVQRLKISNEEVEGAFAIAFWLGLAASVIIYLMADIFEDFFEMHGLDFYIEFLSITLLIGNITAIPAGLIQRDRKFKAMGLIDLFSYIFGYGLVALPLALTGFGAWSLALAQMVQAVSRCVLMFYMRWPAMALWPQKHVAKDLLGDGVGFSAGQMGNFLATEIDYVIVGRWLGAEALGFYNRAYQFLMLPTQLFGAALSTVLFPSIASIQDKHERVARVYLRAQAVIAMVTLPSTMVMIVIAPELVRVTLGGNWVKMTVPFQILIASLLFRTSYKLSDAVTLAMGSMYQRAWRQWVYAGAVAAGAFAGMEWGIAGVAAGVGVAVVLNFILMLNLARKVASLALGPIIRVHLRHLMIGVLIAVPVLAATISMRVMDLSSVEVLAAALAIAGLWSAVLWFRFRRIFGDEGAWFHDLVAARLRNALRRNPS